MLTLQNIFINLKRKCIDFVHKHNKNQIVGKYTIHNLIKDYPINYGVIKGVMAPEIRK